ncbi:hypothetical protein ACLMJK_003427 [Lecanora helva]
MSWLSSIFAGDEELGKKDDDHRPLNGATTPTWSARKPAPAWRRRRIFYAICALLLVYVFVKNIPTDLGPAPRHGFMTPDVQGGKLSSDTQSPPIGRPKRPATGSEAEEHYHDGPIKFYKLAASLHGVARLEGQHEVNKNVLFAASSLKSASELIPLACEMARWDRNNVHVAIMGRDDLEIAELKKVNNIEDEDCKVYWHDARPDFSRWSSDFRMEVSVAASLEHIHSFMHPQILIIDDPDREDQFFTKALRSKAMELGRGIIELPSDAIETMMWMTRLDSGSLAAWTATYVDIMIQASPDSSGSLIRLLKSIENADYFGTRRPHLTIELPTDVDPPTWRYLQNLVWPPLDWSGAPHASQVSLRHRIPRRTLTEHEASARLIESFYPVRTGNSHVLVLSTQAELSPLYYHYVMYNLLEYKYSSYGAATTEFPNLIGFSLELPSFHLNDSAPLDPPLMEKTPLKGKEKGLPGERTPFQWQAPNANAALYFGDKWMEFHSFLSARLTKPPSNRRKVFSLKHPSWLESLLELIRARGYSMLYPNFPSDGDAVVTVHDELYQAPEEYSKPTRTPPPTPDLDSNEPLTADNEKRSRSPPNKEHTLSESSLLSLLPNDGDLPAVSELPLLSYNGITIGRKLSHEAAMAFSELFRREIGGCRSDEETTPRAANSALDLFCHLDEIYDPLEPYNPPPAPPEIPHAHHSMMPVEEEPYDEDAIRAENELDAKQESSAHRARQEDKPAPAPPSPPPPPPPIQQQQQPNLPQQDDSKETQSEFQSQMQRQAKQAGESHPAPIPAPPPPPAKENAPEVPTKPEAPAAAPPAGEPAQSAAPIQSLDGFMKQPPTDAVEAPAAEAAKEKGAGW